MNKVFVVMSHVEVETNNWSTEAVRAFNSFEKAEDFANKLIAQAESNETIEIEELSVE